MPRLSPILLLTIGIVAPAVHAADAAEEDIAWGRQVAGQLVQQTGAALKKELAASGPEGAIGVCRQAAPDIAGQLSRQHGARVARVSLKVRNAALGHPDAWEQAALAEFDRLAASGAKPETLERAEVVDEPAGRYFRYLKALPVQSLCLGCHGSADTIPPGVAQKLAAEYPQDRATGYAVGQIRGAVTVKKLLSDR